MLTHFLLKQKTFLLIAIAIGFPLSVSCQNVQKIIAAPAKEKTFIVPADYFGYNSQMLRGPGWHEPEFTKQVKGLRPQLLRYPGGTVSSYWDWRAGWLKEGLNLKFDWAKIPRTDLTLESLKKGCDETGAVPVFVLNMITSNLSYQVEMLQHAKKLGLPVKYVELDNEVYLGDDFYTSRFPTGVDYANECNIWIKEIKKLFPGVKVAVSGHSARINASKSRKKNFARTDTWNRDVLSTITGADAMTFHVYGGNGLNASMKSFVADEEEEGDNKTPALLQKIFDEPNSVSTILSVPIQRWRNSNAYDYAILPDNMEVWITEFNMFEREGVVAGTWVHGLYALMQAMLFFENSKTAHICYHNLSTSAQFCAIFYNENGFSKAFKKKENKPYDYSAAGYCLQKFGDFLEGADKVTKLRYSDNIKVDGLRGQSYPAIYGWIAESRGVKKILVVNISGNPVEVDFSKIISGETDFQQLASEPRVQVASMNDLIVKSGIASKVVLAPYSVTIIKGE